SMDLNPAEFLFVYMTFPNREEAERVGTMLVEEHLAACVNITDGMQSVYRWQGRVERASETVCIAKTKVALFDALERRVQALHPYECPCIVAMPLAAASPSYLQWLDEQVKDGE
ncbi:MAG: divalent-cation tolerance protein CutA, partial [Flavobacteriales bacterium]|nr:divalent-cation tolerance protein CutA [Flavobacteriales bacterium]